MLSLSGMTEIMTKFHHVLIEHNEKGPGTPKKWHNLHY